MHLRNVFALCVLLFGLGVASASAGTSWNDLLNQVTHATGSKQNAANLPQSDIVAGLKEALAKGTTDAINALGKRGGFWNNPAVRIPLPGPLNKAAALARQVGAGKQADAFQLSLNRAAEKAVPQVADIFGNAIRKMSVSDARGILTGGDHAATDYFRRVAGLALAARIAPIVSTATDSVGITQKYKQFMSGAGGGEVGGVLSMLGGGSSKSDTLNLDKYVTNETLDGLFKTIGNQEKAIRDNPVARTTDLLKKVFGGH